jgi:hypothetical protein
MTESHKRLVILALFQARDWLDLYALHEKFSLSPAQIISTLALLDEQKLCEVDGTRARLTQSGYNWVLKNRRQIFMQSGRKWAKLDSSNKRHLHVGQPYMPRLRSVDKDFYRKLS